MGKFTLIGRYGQNSCGSKHPLFSSQSPLRLHDNAGGRAEVSRALLGEMAVGRVSSSGHDVTVRESVHPTILVPRYGTVRTEIDGRSVAAENGQGLVLGRGRRDTRVEPDSEGRFLAYVFLLPSDSFDALPLVESRRGVILESGRSGNVRQALALSRMLADQLEDGSSLLDRPGASRSWFELLSSALSDGAREMADELQDLRVDGTAAQIHVRRAEEFMTAHFDEVFTTSDVARVLGISIRTLETAFRQVRDESPARILNRIRLNAARRALLSPDGPATVTEVCMECGFGHQGRFSAAYRAAFGELPSTTIKRR
ncbi:helix-turn-helix domain-containing protein [Rhodobacterales bacterium HKCCE3408]|nr:helix-turn-helix domain-containing protein [Rhodobacterales bacterium HKCCE3408]